MEGKSLGCRKEIKKLVVKLGGKTLSDGERIRNLAKKIFSEIEKGRQVAVVVSAMGKTTDILIEQSLKACGKKISPRDMDEILSMGERTSTRFFAAALKAYGAKVRFLDPADKDWPIITDRNFGNANPLMEECIRRSRSVVEPLLSKGIVPVIPGFIGKTLQDEVTTLGRGGSDTTAFILAKALEADEVILVTDVEGIMSADPKIVSNPKKIGKIDAEKLMNLCDSGNKFLHRKALKFIDGSFKVRIISYKSENLEDEGTIIERTTSQNNSSTENCLATITILTKNPSNVLEIVSNLVEEIKRNKIPVSMLFTDAESICICVPDKKAKATVETIHSSPSLRDKILSVALKRRLFWTRIFGIEAKNIHQTIKLATESLRRSGKILVGISTIASNIHIFAEQEQFHQ